MSSHHSRSTGIQVRTFLASYYVYFQCVQSLPAPCGGITRAWLVVFVATDKEGIDCIIPSFQACSEVEIVDLILDVDFLGDAESCQAF
jgi:hypothetical protein